MAGKKETIIVIVWCAVITLLSIVPYWFGAYHAPTGATYMQFIGNNNDQSTYLAWIKQAEEGKILFEDKFTTERQWGVFFHPLFLASGWFSAITGLDALTTYHLLRLVSGFLLLLAAYYFGGLFFKKFSHKFFFLAFVSLSSGFGWLFSGPFLSHNVMCLDLLITEAITFLIVLTKPLFSVSLILMLAIFMLMFKSYSSGKIRFSVLAGLLGLILGLIHPYDMVSVYSIGVLYLILTKSGLKEAKHFILFLALSLPAVIYQYVIFNYDPVFKEWAKTVTATPNPLSFAIGYGLIGLFAILYILRNKKKSKTDLFLISWIICALILVYLPFRFQRRLILGLHIPICIFAVKFTLDHLIPVIKKSIIFKGVRESILLGIIVVLVAPGNFVYMFRNIEDMKINSSKYCLPNEDLEALKWIDKNVPSSEIIIASPVISQYIPGLTGNKVYAGHYDQTINYSKKIRDLADFYKADTTQNWQFNWIEKLKILFTNYIPNAKENYIYIYYGPYEQGVGKPPNLEEFQLITKAYQNNKVIIYRMKIVTYINR